jgi:ABC-type multidrug transport system fused ATPase/permease subunit
MKLFLRQIYEILGRKERRSGALLLVFIFCNSFLDAIGIASLMPFMAVLSNPNLIYENTHLRFVYGILSEAGYGNERDFLILLGLLVFILLLLTAIMKIFTMYLQVRYAFFRERDIGSRLLESFLRQGYASYLKEKSSDLEQSILSEVNQLVSQVLLPTLNLIAQLLLTIFIFTILMVVDIDIAMTVFLTLSGIYISLYFSVRLFLTRIGRSRITSDKQRYKVVSETFSAFKIIKLAQNEDSYLRRFRQAATLFASNQAAAQSISVIPRYFVELIAFGGLITIILYILSTGGDVVSTLPIITLYAMAGYRLMPALQQIYMAISTIRYSRDALHKVHKNLNMIRIENEIEVKAFQPIFNKYISLESVSFCYSNSDKPAVTNIDFTIQANTTVGLVGVTGSGKSTVMDILLGLLVPTDGTLRIDGAEISGSRLSDWRNIVGHVPQDIFLIDGTIAENIAFGEEGSAINYDQVFKVAKIANVHDFVLTKTQNGYETEVGERGVRLSGGQLQRIGIARALYREPRVLILDEATSALDNATEKSVMDSLRNINNDLTIIMVAHRLSTVKHCNNIFVFSDGHLVDQGDYSYLKRSSSAFRSLIS